jgi:nitroreductase
MNNQQAIDQVIKDRRSVRAYLPTPVPQELVSEIIEVASRAPSGNNAQPWHVYAVVGETKDSLCGELHDQFLNNPTAHRPEYRYYPKDMVEPFLTRKRRNGIALYTLLGLSKENTEGMRQQHAKNLQFFGAPVGLFFTIDRSMATGGWLDCGMFIQSVMLAAKARGLDTCPQAAFTQFHQIIGQRLNFPANQQLVCGMSLGYADNSKIENSLVTEREPVTSILTFK